MKPKFVIIFAALLLGGVAVAQTEKVDSVFAQRLADEQLTDSTDEQRCAYRFAEGVRLRLAGQYSEAFECFAQCVALCDDAESHYEMWRIAKTSKDSADILLAQQHLHQAIERAPDNATYKEALAEWCIENNYYGSAAAIYEDLLKAHPNSERYLYTLVALYANYPKRQLELLRRLERLNGVSEENSYSQISILMVQKRYCEAEKQILKLIDRFPYETDYKTLLGDLYLDCGKEKKALACYAQILAADSLNGTTLVSLASYYGAHGDSIRANECMFKSLYDKRLPLEERMFWLRPHLVALVQANDTAQIDTLFGLLVALYPDDEQTWQLQVDYLLSRGDVAATEPLLRRILALNPQNEDAWVKLLQACDCSIDDALALIDGALEQFPKSPYWHYYRMNTLFALGRSVDALTEIDTAIAIDMDNAAKALFYLTRADFMSQITLYAAAIADYEEALSLDPANVLTQNNYAYLLACAGRDLAKAEKMSSAAVKAAPENATYLDTYAWVLFVRGDYRLARFYQERAVALAEASERAVNAEFYEHYGDILSLLGETDAAVEQWRKALILNIESPILLQKIETRQYIPNPIEIKNDETK